MKTAVHGFSTKTITIPTVAGVYTYNLGDYQDDNFGEHSKIIGISSRIAVAGATVRSRFDRPIIDKTYAISSYLNLMKNTVERENLIYQTNLFALSREYDHVQNAYDLFIEPNLINWGESQIQIEPNFVIPGTHDIELNIYYITNCQKPIETNIVFDNKFEYLGLFKFNVEVETKAGVPIYKINNGRNPLPKGAILVGMRINNYNLVTLNGNSGIFISNYLGASFLNMRVGSRVMLENFPLPDLVPFDRFGYSYFQIEPTLAKDFDWSNCEIFVSDKSIPLDDYSYLITFFYIKQK